MKKMIEWLRWWLAFPSRFEMLLERVLSAVWSLRKGGAPTYVYVLPAGGGGMLAQSAVVTPGTTMQIVFSNVMSIPKGSWVVAVGPAVVTELRIGNVSQIGWASFDGHVASTWDEAGPGTRIMVALRG
jgi:hypothetical protein